MHVDHGFCIKQNGKILLAQMNHQSVHCGYFMFPKQIDGRLGHLDKIYMPAIKGGTGHKAPVCTTALLIVPDEMDIELIMYPKIRGYKWFASNDNKNNIHPSTRLYVDYAFNV